MIASSPPAPRAAANPIDALVTAGRLYAAHAAVLLPIALFLQALKAATLLGLMDVLGEDVGSLLGRITSTALLWALMGVAALLALDARGGAVGSGGSLVQRGLALLPKVLLLAFLYTFAIAAGLALVIVPGLIALVLGLLAMPALIAGNLAPKAALKESSRLVQTALLPSILLAALLAFSLELIPALTDSAVGRHAPLGNWLVAEATISAFITPLMALAITAFFIALADAEGSLSPRPPTPADAITAARNTALPGSQRPAQPAAVSYQPPPATVRPLATFTPAPAPPGIGGDLARVMQVPAQLQRRQRLLGRFVGAWEVRHDPEQDLIDLVRKKPGPPIAVDAMNGLLVLIGVAVAVQAALSLAGIV